MNKYYIIPILLIFTACTRIVENDFKDFSDFHAVNCILSADSQIVVNVSKTLGLNKTQVEYEEQAEIDLYINGSFHSTLTYQDEGNYIAEVIVEEGKEYKFIVQIPNRETFKIEKKVPVASKIFSIDHINNFAVNEEGVSTPALKFLIENNYNNLRFYHLLISQVIESPFDNETTITPVQIEELIDQLLIREGIPILSFNNQGVNDSIIDLTVNYSSENEIMINDQWVLQLYPLLIELRTTDQDYYELIKSQYLYEEASIPLLDGNNRASYEPYYLTYAEGVIGLTVAYSKVIADTLYVENQFQ